jgi:hypothetical protein
MTLRETDLTLAETVYLLQCEPGRRRLRDRSLVTPRLVRAAVLADLALRHLIEDEQGKVRLLQGTAPADALSRFVLGTIASSKPRTWKAWIQRDNGKTIDLVEDRLSSSGFITVIRKRMLKVFPAREIVVHDPGLIDAIRQDVRAIALGPDPIEDITPERATLAALVAGAEMRSVISRREARQAKQRIEKLMQATGPFAPSLRRAIRDAQGAIAAVTASSGAIAASN